MSFKETSFSAPARHNPELHAIIRREIRDLPKGEVLDLPSGPGYLLRDLQKDGFTGVAGEIDSDLHCFPEMKYERIDMIQKFPFEDNRFDYVTSVEGIEHIENHFAFFREIARVLKPGGRLFLTTPNMNTLESRFQYFISGFHLAAAKPIPLDSANMYFEHINPIEFQNLYFSAERVGLEVEKLITWKYKKGSWLWYILLWPFLQLAIRHACLGRERGPARRQANRRLYKFMRSRANLLGSHAIIVARKKP